MKKENFTHFILGIVLGGLLFVSTDYPVYNKKIEIAAILCGSAGYKEIRIDITGQVKKVICSDDKIFIISKLNLSELEQTNKKNSK